VIDATKPCHRWIAVEQWTRSEKLRDVVGVSAECCNPGCTVVVVAMEPVPFIDVRESSVICLVARNLTVTVTRQLGTPRACHPRPGIFMRP